MNRIVAEACKEVTKPFLRIYIPGSDEFYEDIEGQNPDLAKEILSSPGFNALRIVTKCTLRAQLLSALARAESNTYFSPMINRAINNKLWVVFYD